MGDDVVSEAGRGRRGQEVIGVDMYLYSARLGGRNLTVYPSHLVALGMSTCIHGLSLPLSRVSLLYKNPYRVLPLEKSNRSDCRPRFVRYVNE